MEQIFNLLGTEVNGVLIILLVLAVILLIRSAFKQDVKALQEKAFETNMERIGHMLRNANTNKEDFLRHCDASFDAYRKVAEAAKVVANKEKL